MVLVVLLMSYSVVPVVLLVAHVGDGRGRPGLVVLCRPGGVGADADRLVVGGGGRILGRFVLGLRADHLAIRIELFLGALGWCRN